MKNEKLSLTELKVKSFVTDFESGVEDTIKGGRANPDSPTTYPPSIILCTTVAPIMCRKQ